MAKLSEKKKDISHLQVDVSGRKSNACLKKKKKTIRHLIRAE